jgi:hypothetical protein
MLIRFFLDRRKTLWIIEYKQVNSSVISKINTETTGDKNYTASELASPS